MQIEKKTWFITGVSRGLGKALAQAALDRGDTVIGTSRDGNADLESGAGKLHMMALDVTNRVKVFAAIERAHELNWRLDVVVNNAGYGLLGPMEGTDPTEFNAVMDVNFTGTVNVMQAALPYLREQQSGHIINLSSIAGLAPYGGYAFYAAAKFAVEGISTAVHHEVKEHNIKVTVVEPGAFRTDFLAERSIKKTGSTLEAYANSAGQVEKKLEQMNGNQLGDPEKAARAILEAVDSEKPPLHLLLGSDAYQRATENLETMRQEFEDWKQVTLSTDYKNLVAHN